MKNLKLLFPTILVLLLAAFLFWYSINSKINHLKQIIKNSIINDEIIISSIGDIKKIEFIVIGINDFKKEASPQHLCRVYGASKTVIVAVETCSTPSDTEVRVCNVKIVN